MLWDGTPDVKLAPLRERVSINGVIGRKGLLSYRAHSGKWENPGRFAPGKPQLGVSIVRSDPWVRIKTAQSSGELYRRTVLSPLQQKP